jgi:hypothetical protein
VTAEARHIAKIVRSADGDADDPTRVVGGGTPSHRADAGIAWGTLIHGLLEHAMRHKSATRDDLRRLALWLTVEEPQLRAVIDDALQTVEVVAAEDFWKKAITSEHQVLGGGAILRLHVGSSWNDKPFERRSGSRASRRWSMERRRLQNGSRRSVFDDPV